jgi:predicted nucleic acid-binding protein
MAAGLIDTSVVVDWDDSTVIERLPDEVAVSTITLAELATGPHLAADAGERARRQARLQQAEALFDPIDFDRAAARSYGEVVAAVAAMGRSHRARLADLLIAAVAHANGLALYTRNPRDFVGLETLIAVTAV